MESPGFPKRERPLDPPHSPNGEGDRRNGGGGAGRQMQPAPISTAKARRPASGGQGHRPCTQPSPHRPPHPAHPKPVAGPTTHPHTSPRTVAPDFIRGSASLRLTRWSQLHLVSPEFLEGRSGGQVNRQHHRLRNQLRLKLPRSQHRESRVPVTEMHQRRPKQ